MKSFKVFYLISINILILACGQESRNHIGEWQLDKNGKTVGVIEVTDTTLTIYEVRFNLCDTTYSERAIFNLTNIQIEKDKINISLEAEGFELKAIMNYTSNTEGEFCLQERKESACYIFKKSSFNPGDKPKKEILFKGFLSILEYGILNSDEQYKRTINEVILSADGKSLINYVDSLRDELLGKYNLVYKEVESWKCVDSLTAYKSPSLFLVGVEPSLPKESYFSAYTLKMKLIDYLSEKSNSMDVEVIFPFYQDKNEPTYGWLDPHTNWESGIFYNQILGISIKELNKIKVQIVQLERISQNLKNAH